MNSFGKHTPLHNQILTATACHQSNHVKFFTDAWDILANSDICYQLAVKPGLPLQSLGLLNTVADNQRFITIQHLRGLLQCFDTAVKQRNIIELMFLQDLLRKDPEFTTSSSLTSPELDLQKGRERWN